MTSINMVRGQSGLQQSASAYLNDSPRSLHASRSAPQIRHIAPDASRSLILDAIHHRLDGVRPNRSLLSSVRNLFAQIRHALTSSLLAGYHMVTGRPDIVDVPVANGVVIERTVDEAALDVLLRAATEKAEAQREDFHPMRNAQPRQPSRPSLLSQLSEYTPPGSPAGSPSAHKHQHTPYRAPENTGRRSPSREPAYSYGSFSSRAPQSLFRTTDNDVRMGYRAPSSPSTSSSGSLRQASRSPSSSPRHSAHSLSHPSSARMSPRQRSTHASEQSASFISDAEYSLTAAVTASRVDSRSGLQQPLRTGMHAASAVHQTEALKAARDVDLIEAPLMFSADEVDIQKITDFLARQAAQGGVVRLSGESNGCWMRSAWMSVIAQYAARPRGGEQLRQRLIEQLTAKGRHVEVLRPYIDCMKDMVDAVARTPGPMSERIKGSRILEREQLDPAYREAGIPATAMPFLLSHPGANGRPGSINAEEAGKRLLFALTNFDVIDPQADLQTGSVRRPGDAHHAEYQSGKARGGDTDFDIEWGRCQDAHVIADLHKSLAVDTMVFSIVPARNERTERRGSNMFVTLGCGNPHGEVRRLLDAWERQPRTLDAAGTTPLTRELLTQKLLALAPALSYQIHQHSHFNTGFGTV
jgi:hypothetical protein